MSTVLEDPAVRSAVADDSPSRGSTVPWHVQAVVFASLCVLVGVIWDISWHQSIGRDTLFSPPHLAIYLGGIVAGVTCGMIVLRMSFAATTVERARGVSFWRYFRGPLGAWICIWGAFAMLTSAPFDDWWHSAYGLDTKILSPPHALLAAGIGAINLGALVLVAPRATTATGAERRRLGMLYTATCGLLLLMLATIVSEYHYRIYMHGSRFYIVAGLAFPLVLAAAARSAPVRWSATLTAAAYSIVTLAMMWILPLFPAEPKLAPIYHEVTRMVPPSFPLLVIVPALLIDVVVHRFRADSRDALLAAALGILFTVSFMAVQMPFAVFLMSDLAQNPLFAANNIPYQVPETSYYVRRLFLPLDANTDAWRRGMLIATACATLSAWVGLKWGRWLQRVKR